MISKRRMVAPARHDQLARLASFAAAAAAEVGFDELQINRIELAVDEACSNIIDHAYSGQPGEITIEVSGERGHNLLIVIIDQGKPFDPSSVQEYVPSSSLDDAKVGGLGLHLMRQTMDQVCFEFGVPGVGNRLTMEKFVRGR
ncbi:MAG: ATP-binding protein [Anaerolineae bacterium]|nr:ATP-binding protein [Thermoflexales bacterium]MDW8408960.1 ATP-binding protein [Anaerolineae bacterium]